MGEQVPIHGEQLFEHLVVFGGQFVRLEVRNFGHVHFFPVKGFPCRTGAAGAGVPGLKKFVLGSRPSGMAGLLFLDALYARSGHVCHDRGLRCEVARRVESASRINFKSRLTLEARN